MLTLADAKEQLVDIMQASLRSGLVHGTAGNAACRLDDGNVAVTPTSVPYDTMTTDDIVAFTHTLRGQGLAESSVARTLVTVRGLHRFRVAEGLSDHDPTADAEQRIPA